MSDDGAHQSAGPATHRLDARARGHPCDESSRTGGRNASGRAQRTGDGGPRLAARDGALAWYERYGKRIEDTRLPQGQANRDAYAQTVGEDGLALLDALDASDVPEGLRVLARVAALRRTSQRHYDRTPRASPGGPDPGRPLRLKESR